MIFYIIPEIRYGIGLPELSAQPMMIITSHRHPAISLMRADGNSIWCAEEEGEVPHYQAHQLLELEKVQKLILDSPEPERKLLTFKITPRFEKLAGELQAQVLMPSYKLNRFWEDKNKGMAELKKLGLPVKDALAGLWQEFTYEGTIARFGGNELVVQKPRGMAGSSTHFIRSQTDWDELGKILGINPLVKVSPFLVGDTYTVNALVNITGLYCGYPMFQITGDQKYTRYEGGTSGVDMSGGRIFAPAVLGEIKNITQKIGEALSGDGFWGWFGVDFIVDKNDKVTVIEINPRFTASVSVFSQAQASQFTANFWSANLDLQQKLPELMQPLPFTTLIVRNVSLENMVVAQHFTPGMYHLEGDRLILKKETVFIKDMTNPQEYLIIAKGKEMEIHPDGEMATIVAHRSALQGDHIDDDLGKVANLVTMALKKQL